MDDDLVAIPDHRPTGYEAKTRCCVHCRFVSDHSHPDGLELYCGFDHTEPKSPSFDRDFDEQWYAERSKWMEWSVSRSVEAWAVCLKFEPKEVKAK